MTADWTIRAARDGGAKRHPKWARFSTPSAELLETEIAEQAAATSHAETHGPFRAGPFMPICFATMCSGKPSPASNGSVA